MHRIVVLAAAIAMCGGPACAAPLVMPVYKPALDQFQTGQTPEGRRADFHLTERPVGEVIAIRLGIAQGRAELFRFRVENAPSDKTMLDGVVDGGGLKLKLTW